MDYLIWLKFLVTFLGWFGTLVCLALIMLGAYEIINWTYRRYKRK